MLLGEVLTFETSFSKAVIIIFVVVLLVKFGGKMKIWIIFVVVILAIAGIVVMNALQSQSESVESCSVLEEEMVCGNSCSVGNVCSNPSCGVRTGGGCGCGG